MTENHQIKGDKKGGKKKYSRDGTSGTEQEGKFNPPNMSYYII